MKKRQKQAHGFAAQMGVKTSLGTINYHSQQKHTEVDNILIYGTPVVEFDFGGSPRFLILKV